MSTSEERICPHCGRRVLWNRRWAHSNPEYGTYCYVVHDYYGCDSGCCGYRAVVCDVNGRVVEEEFDFGHPRDEDSFHEFVENFVRNHWCSVPIDFDKCEYVEYC